MKIPLIIKSNLHDLRYDNAISALLKYTRREDAIK